MKNELIILLIGQKGSGKSFVGSLLFGNKKGYPEKTKRFGRPPTSLFRRLNISRINKPNEL